MDRSRHTVILCRAHLLNRFLPEADLGSRVVGLCAADIIGSLVIGCVAHSSLALRTERARVETGTLVFPIVLFHHLLLLRCHHLVG